MDCKRTANLMMKYFDHAIGDLEEEEMSLHIQGCKNCSLEFHWIQEAMGAVENMEEREAPEGFESFIMEKIPKGYYKPSMQRSNFFNYMTFAVAITVIFFSGLLYLRYGTVEVGEIYDLMRFVFALMDIQDISQNIAALISKNMIGILIFGIRWLNSMATFLINTRMSVYLLILGSLCSLFIGIQHWLVRLTYEAGYEGGKIYEK